jgi:hypothetical protein
MLCLTARLQGARTAFDPDDPDVLDVLAAVTAPPFSSPHSGLPAWIARVRQRLDDGDLARVRTIAHDEGVHPVYLARAFRRWVGCSVAGYLNRARVPLQRGHRNGARPVPAAVGLVHLCSGRTVAAGLIPRRRPRQVAFIQGPAGRRGLP